MLDRSYADLAMNPIWRDIVAKIEDKRLKKTQKLLGNSLKNQEDYQYELGFFHGLDFFLKLIPEKGKK